MTTAAQNIHVFLRESSLHKKHFFEWLETAISSNACGMSTLKSLLPQAFAVSNVHPRLRKRLSRCTLDCGFKTSESPALRGFEAERCPITGTSLYLVLLSNGLRHSKNLPVKFGFSPIDTPANIAKKLPSQRCSQPLFNFSHKRPTFAFTSESGHTLGSRRKIAHNGSHAETGGLPFCEHSVALRCQRNTFYSTVLLYTYISRFSVNPHYQQKRNIRQSCRHKFYPQPLFIVFFNFLHKRPTFAFTSESGHTLGSRRKIAHNGSHGETRGVSDGGAITTLGAFHTFRKPCVAGV